MSDSDAVRFLDKLIELWGQWDANEDYYLGELAPKIVRSTDFEWLDQEERRVVTTLRELLQARTSGTDSPNFCVGDVRSNATRGGRGPRASNVYARSN